MLQPLQPQQKEMLAIIKHEAGKENLSINTFSCKVNQILEAQQCRQYSNLATGWTEESSFDSQQGQEIIFSKMSRPTLEPASVSAHTRNTFLGGKIMRHEADNSPPCSIKVNEWSYTSAPYRCRARRQPLWQS
jgi:hypothetical protein